MLHLEHSATLLQKIHFPEYMKGYRLFLLADGSWSSRSKEAMASLFVSQDGIELTVHHSKVSTTIQTELDTPLEITDSIQILFRNWTYTLTKYTTAPSWWPYIGKITIPPRLNRYPFDSELHIGRKPGAAITLPSDGHCENIFWNDGLTLVDTIPTPSGVIPKKRFATDMINVSSHHGTFSLVERNVLLKCESTQCPIFLKRSDETIILSPNAPNATGISAIVNVGDEIFVGNHCFYVMRLPDCTLQTDNGVDAIFEDEIPVIEDLDQLVAQDTDVFIFGSQTETNLQTGQIKDPTALQPEAALSSSPISIAEQDWELSLQSTSRIKIHGWIIKGEVQIGNHIDCGICIPENQTVPQQTFSSQAYATAHIRGGKGHIEILNPEEFECLNPNAPLLYQRFSVARRSSSGNIDFKIPLSLSSESPVPGSLLLKLDHTDETVSSMFHLGIFEDFTQVLQLCQYTCTTKVDDNLLNIIAPTEIRLMVKNQGSWQVCQDSCLTLKPNGYAIIGTLLIQFIQGKQGTSQSS